MTCIPVRGPDGHRDQVIKRGKTRRGSQRYLCQNVACTPRSFLLAYSYRGRLSAVQQQRIDMSLHASGVRDTARVLWSCVGKKPEPRWFWQAIDHTTGAVLADVCGRRQDEVLPQ